MVVPGGLPPVAQPPDSSGEFGIAGAHGTAVAKRPEVLGGVEAVGGGHTGRAHGDTIARCQVGLTAVFDERQSVSLGQRGERSQVRRLAIQMDRQHGGGAWPNQRRDGRRVERQTLRVDVGEYWSCSGHHDGLRGVHRRQCGRDHLVARADAQGPQYQRQGVGA